MRHTLTGLLLAAATCAFAVTAPAVAQTTSTPSHPKKHIYANATAEVQQAPSGGVGALGPLNAMMGAPNGGSCGIATDYMGRQTGLCGL
jgi:hypothetical protein